jgi:hypothetical protein
MFRTGMTLLIGLTAATFICESKIDGLLKVYAVPAVVGATFAALPKPKPTKYDKERWARRRKWEAALREDEARLQARLRLGFDPHP